MNNLIADITKYYLKKKGTDEILILNQLSKINTWIGIKIADLNRAPRGISKETTSAIGIETHAWCLFQSLMTILLTVADEVEASSEAPINKEIREEWHRSESDESAEG